MKLHHNPRKAFHGFALCLALLGAIACGDADIGEECEDVGSTDECEDGAICTNDTVGTVCRALCAEDADCPETHACNGISGTNQKSCQPKM